MTTQVQKFGATTASGEYMTCLIGGAWHFCPTDHEWLTYNANNSFSEPFVTEGEALDAAEAWEAASNRAESAVTIRAETAPGTSASSIGERYGATNGIAWRNAVDRCDSDGGGRVFFDCDNRDVAEWLESQLENDDSITAYGEE